MKKIIASLAILMISGCSGSDRELSGPTSSQESVNSPLKGPLIMIAIDSLHPSYLDLDRSGNRGGSDGNWLMPNIHRFLSGASWYKNAEAYLPAATDMNHINALAGTSSALTGEIGISTMMTGWRAPTDRWGKYSKWTPILEKTDMAMLRDNEGRSVDTLFHSWKREHPESKTAFISGKGWVAEMFRSQKVVDLIVTGDSHPDYIKSPERRSMIDPPGDEDGACEPRSLKQRAFSAFLESKSSKFPSDKWTVDAALKIFEKENPGMTYILLAQQDDEGHALGAAFNPDEFTESKSSHIPRIGCKFRPEYRLVSKRDRAVYREPILDAAREVDRQFGRLMDGLRERGVLENAAVVLFSDHSMVTHQEVYDKKVVKSTDIKAILAKEGLIGKDDFFPYTATSIGLLYFRNGKERVPRAKEVLEAQKVYNRQTAQPESPWYVLDRDDMRNGVEGVALPGELYHAYFVDADREKSIVWPDLVVLAKNGWQLPTYGGLAMNIGVSFPDTKLDLSFLRLYPLTGGHGSIDTRPIVMAFSLPYRKQQVLERKTMISDIAATLSSLYNLRIQSTMSGEDLSSEVR
ncbi:MAG: alkaline phosphatase family protein [Oligoflexales bacterium]|nr:alkaline phosphatase family protein [Oligoflexales bacterium]